MFTCSLLLKRYHGHFRHCVVWHFTEARAVQNLSK